MCGCASYPSITLPYFSQKGFLVETNDTKSVLYISHKDESYNFSLFDSLGIPLSSKTLSAGKFHSQKFLHPHPLHDRIFIETLQMLEQNEHYKEFKIQSDTIKVRELESVY